MRGDGLRAVCRGIEFGTSEDSKAGRKRSCLPKYPEAMKPALEAYRRAEDDALRSEAMKGVPFLSLKLSGQHKPNDQFSIPSTFAGPKPSLR